jgi:hypothetical protein
MAYPVAVRFVVSGSNVDFYEDEIQSVRLLTQQGHEIQVHQTGNAYLFTDGSQYDTVEIQFGLGRSGTKAKIDQLIDAEDEMTLYYAYAYVPATNVTCVLHLNGRLHEYNYYFGELEANVTKTLTFLVT